MNNSILIIEFGSISKGYEKINEILHNFPVEVIYSRNICPGKILFILVGSDSDINQINNLDNISSNKGQILNVSGEVLEALNKNQVKKHIKSLLIMELISTYDGIIAADYCYKSTNIDILTIKSTIGFFGKSIVIINGNLSDLRECVILADEVLLKTHIINMSIIEKPTEGLINML